jgi:hypothetical protein
MLISTQLMLEGDSAILLLLIVVITLGLSFHIYRITSRSIQM